MATACITQTTLQVHGISKPIVARFDQPQASSDGGAMLLKAVDDRLGLTWRLASALRDRRQPGKVVDPFVRALYEELSNGLTVAEAVQRAKLARQRAGASPAEWSAFVLYGDGRARIPLKRPGAHLIWWSLAAAIAGAVFWYSERRLRRS